MTPEQFLDNKRALLQAFPLANLPTPTPGEIKKARGVLTQAQAGELIGLSKFENREKGHTACKAWADYETGLRPIPNVKWAAFLLATNQHPVLRVVRCKN